MPLKKKTLKDNFKFSSPNLNSFEYEGEIDEQQIRNYLQQGYDVTVDGRTYTLGNDGSIIQQAEELPEVKVTAKKTEKGNNKKSLAEVNLVQNYLDNFMNQWLKENQSPVYGHYTGFYDYTKPPKYKGGGEVKTNQNKNNYRPTITESTPVEQDTRNVFEELKKAAEALYTQKKTADDSTLENILEIIDPTGVTSWDDIYRSYNKTGMSKEMFLEAVGALPIVGKFGKGVKATSKMAKELLKDISLISSTSKRGMPLAPFIIPPLSVAMSAPYIGRSLDAMDAYNQYPTSPGIWGDSYALPEVTIKAKRNNKK